MANPYGLPDNNILTSFLMTGDATDRGNALRTQNMAGQIGILGALQQQALRRKAMEDEAALRNAVQSGDPNRIAATPGGIGILKQLAEIENAKRTGQLRDAQLGDLQRKSQISQGEQSAKSALANLLTPSGSFGQGTDMERPNAQVFSTDADAIAAMRDAEARGVPFTGNVPNPANVRALTAQAGNAIPAATSREILRPLSQTTTQRQPALSNIGKLMAERDALPDGDPRRAQYDRIIAGTQSAGGVNVSVTANQEKEESKAVGKEFGDVYNNIQKAAMQSSQKLNTIQRIDQLLTGVETGRLTPLGTEIASIAKSLGIDIDKNLGNKQAAEALASELALQLRNPAGGAGMPGALSDKDLAFLRSMVPGLAMSKEGRGVLVETHKIMAKRDQQVAQMARDYRRRKGSFDDGFYDELKAFSEKNPLFDNMKLPQTEAVKPDSGIEFNGYRFPNQDALNRYKKAAGL